MKNNLFKIELFKKSDDTKNLIEDTEYHLRDIKEEIDSYNKLYEKLLNSSLTEEEAFGVFNDLGESLRHILYHINNIKCFSYLKDSIPD